MITTRAGPPEKPQDCAYYRRGHGGANPPEDPQRPPGARRWIRRRSFCAAERQSSPGLPGSPLGHAMSKGQPAAQCNRHDQRPGKPQHLVTSHAASAPSLRWLTQV